MTKGCKKSKKITLIIVLSLVPFAYHLRPTLLERHKTKEAGVGSCQKWLVLV